MAFTPDKSGIGIELQEILRERGLKQVDLAKYLDLTPAAVSQFFHGKTLPSPKQFERILEFLRPDSSDVGRLVRVFYSIRQGGALDKSEFNRSFFALRCQAGLSLKKLAAQSGLSVGRLEELEKSPEAAPEGDELEILARELKCAPSILCGVMPAKKASTGILEAAEGTEKGELRLPVLTLHDLAFYKEGEDFGVFAATRAQSYRKHPAVSGARAWIEASATRLQLRPAASVSLVLGDPGKKRRGGLFLGRGRRGGFLFWEQVRKGIWEPLSGLVAPSRMNTAVWRIPVLEMNFRPSSTAGAETP